MTCVDNEIPKDIRNLIDYKLIRKKRQKLNMSVNELAEKAGVAKSTIRNLEQGYGKDIKLSTTLKLCDILKLSLYDFCL